MDDVFQRKTVRHVSLEIMSITMHVIVRDKLVGVGRSRERSYL